MQVKIHQLSDFEKGYIECALWASTDGDDIPLDRFYNICDIAYESYVQMITDCKDFIQKMPERLFKQIDSSVAYENMEWSQVGHDFWLTRNRHGAGFWSKEDYYFDGMDKRLTETSHSFSEQTLYVGDDGKIHLG